MTKTFSIVIFGGFILNIAIAPIAIAMEQLRYPSSHKEQDRIAEQYVVGLLTLILDKTEQEFGSMEVVNSIDMQQARTVMQLQRGRHIDVLSFGASIEREKTLLAVKIPVYRGVLGFRMSIIRKDFETEFSKIKNLDDLKKYSACQGEHWPDSDILEAAGLQVVRNSNHEGLFRQIAAKRCDYFPRGVQEGPIELAAKKDLYPELMLYRHLIIYYPYPAYFFVNKNNTFLHQRLLKGFNLAIKDGSYQRYLHTNPATKNIFPVSQWLDNPTIVLANPLLSKGTDVTNSLYWVIPKH